MSMHWTIPNHKFSHKEHTHKSFIHINSMNAKLWWNLSNNHQPKFALAPANWPKRDDLLYSKKKKKNMKRTNTLGQLFTALKLNTPKHKKKYDMEKLDLECLFFFFRARALALSFGLRFVCNFSNSLMWIMAKIAVFSQSHNSRGKIN